MAHDYHEGLPGYDPARILHDGCSECEWRARHHDHGINSLDRDSFARAWTRAADWNLRYLRGSVGLKLSNAELPMLSTLWAIQVQLERYGQPIGTLPVRARTSAAGERS